MIRVLILFLACLCACNDRVPPVEQLRYFDNKAWFKQELLRLKHENPQLEKQLFTGGDSTSLLMTPESWEKELAVFLETDLSKAVYSGKLKPDTQLISWQAIETVRISYLATDPNINIRKYTVLKQGDKVSSLSAEIESRSPLLQSLIHWTYMPDSGYVLLATHEMKGVRKNQASVRARFRKNSNTRP
jgi:hypothetical protein